MILNKIIHGSILRANRDSVHKARAAYLIDRDQTHEGINTRDET